MPPISHCHGSTMLRLGIAAILLVVALAVRVSSALGSSCNASAPRSDCGAFSSSLRDLGLNRISYLSLLQATSVSTRQSAKRRDVAGLRYRYIPSNSASYYLLCIALYTQSGPWCFYANGPSPSGICEKDAPRTDCGRQNYGKQLLL